MRREEPTIETADTAAPARRVASARGFLALEIALATGLLLAACAPTVTRHGHHFNDTDVQQVQVGMSQNQVAGVLGSPTTTATVNGAQTFYYISSTQEQTAFFTPKETDRKVLAVYFSPLGSVDRVSQYGLKDGKVVNFSKNQTQSHARDESIIKSLFRNLGTKQLFGE
ncbi:MAG TPA: outer membrane protein assembly factor BamE [Hyphomicrobiaceae bacterium]|nr:outer membrane protein assembly factor BamE [Hyphomicrobiaceae bacterium]